VWLALIMSGSPTRADAPREPPDVVTQTGADALLPALPEGFIRERTGNVVWELHASAASLAHGLERALPDLWLRITTELGASISDELTIRIARGPKDMQRLAPAGAPPPAYAVGVAYPGRGLIILSVVAPGTWLPPDMEGVLAHELSHIALHRAVGGRPLPLWFVEGVAVHQAREQNVARIRTLWEATIGGSVLPLSEVSRHFPATAHQVNLAYAQSADLVNYMVRSEPRAFGEGLSGLLSRVRNGKTFEGAVLASFRMDLPTLEHEWRQGLRERFQLWPLLLSGTAIWTGIGVLAVFSFIRRRRQHREKLSRWEEEEAAYDRAVQVLSVAERIPQRLDFSEQGGLSGLPTHEPGIPTVEHEGQRHTLH
jgi:hypothetical protein